MSRAEEMVLTRWWSGWTIVTASLVLGVVGVAPLLLYILLGPADGNPIGLGLLAVAAVPLAGCGVLVGLVVGIVQHVYRRSRHHGE